MKEQKAVVTEEGSSSFKQNSGDKSRPVSDGEEYVEKKCLIKEYNYPGCEGVFYVQKHELTTSPWLCEKCRERER